MNMGLAGYDEMVVCPYDKCHVIMKQRMQAHLIKCARNHPNMQLEICPFDITHRFPASEKQRHLDECPSRVNFDRYMYRVDNGNSTKPTDKKTVEIVPKNNNDDDDWD